MKEKLELINECLNWHARAYSDAYFYKNYETMYDLATSTLEKIDNVEGKVRPSFTTFLSGYDSIEIVRNYLYKLGNKYVKKFDKCLADGTFNFSDRKDDNIYEEKRSYCVGRERNYPFDNINVSLFHDYRDPGTIIHEFFHLLNARRYKSKYKLVPKMYDTRDVFTEMISIYFENKCYDYMEMLGYDKKEIANCRGFRLQDTYLCAKKLKEELPLYIAFENFGELKEDTYIDIEQYKNLGISLGNKEEYEQSIDKLLKRIDKETYYTPNIALGYLFGDNLVNYMLIHERPETEQLMLSLNRKIYDDDVENSLIHLKLLICNKDVIEPLSDATVAILEENLNIIKEDMKKR